VCNGWEGHAECTISAGLNMTTKVSLGISKYMWDDNIKSDETKNRLFGCAVI
jgi:hypothetical protein